MGTRGLTRVKVDGEFRVAQYGQWDHYPGGQGLDALHFVRDSGPDFLGRLRANALSAVPMSDGEYKRTWVNAGDVPDNNTGFVSFAIADKHSKMYPQLSRDTGAGILELVANQPEIALRLDPHFAEDRLFCEGIVTVDFDANTFAFDAWGNEHSWPLDVLPTDDEFLSVFDDLIDEDED